MGGRPEVERGGGRSLFVFDAELCTWNDVPGVFILAA